MKKSIAINHLHINTFTIKFFTDTTCCATGHSLHVVLQPSSVVCNRGQPTCCATAIFMDV